MKTKKSKSQMRLSGEAAAAPLAACGGGVANTPPIAAAPTPADAITISGNTLRVPD